MQRICGGSQQVVEVVQALSELPDAAPRVTAIVMW